MRQVSLDAEDIRNEKVKVLRNMSPISMENVVIGQYRGRGKKQGYLDDPTVPEGRWAYPTPSTPHRHCFIVAGQPSCSSHLMHALPFQALLQLVQNKLWLHA